MFKFFSCVFHFILKFNLFNAFYVQKQRSLLFLNIVFSKCGNVFYFLKFISIQIQYGLLFT